MKCTFSLALSVRQALLVTMAVCLDAQASNLVVVADQGGASALPYYQDLVASSPTPSPQGATPIGVRGSGAFPVKTLELSPGSVQGRTINAPGLQAMFLVGDDERSKAWLQQRREELLRLNAVGLVVNVASEARLNAIKSWAPGVPLAPTPGSDIAKRLGISHYPVLITSTTIQP